MKRNSILPGSYRKIINNVKKFDSLSRNKKARIAPGMFTLLHCFKNASMSATPGTTGSFRVVRVFDGKPACGRRIKKINFRTVKV